VGGVDGQVGLRRVGGSFCLYVMYFVYLFGFGSHINTQFEYKMDFHCFGESCCICEDVDVIYQALGFLSRVCVWTMMCLDMWM
jgi:hypothetical protein